MGKLIVECFIKKGRIFGVACVIDGGKDDSKANIGETEFDCLVDARRVAGHAAFVSGTNKD
jgi:hypothetical protein